MPTFESIPEIPREYRGGTWNFFRAIKSVLEKIISLFNSLDDDWTYPNLLNSWQQYSPAFGSPRYRKDMAGNVHLQGLLAGGTPSTGSTAIMFILPVRYRPNERIIIPAGCNTGSCRLDITSAGEVWPIDGTGTWYSISNIIFKADH